MNPKCFWINLVRSDEFGFVPPQSDSCSLSQSHCSGCSGENKSITHSLVRGKQGQDVAASSSSMDDLHISFKIDMTSLYIQMLRLKRARLSDCRVLKPSPAHSDPFQPFSFLHGQLCHLSPCGIWVQASQDRLHLVHLNLPEAAASSASSTTERKDK